MLNDKPVPTFQAYAAVKFADSCLHGLRGDAAVIQCAFVSSEACILNILMLKFLCSLYLLHHMTIFWNIDNLVGS